MSAREKLVELICKVGKNLRICESPTGECRSCYKLADHLISNGVIAQEWISVEDRLPEEGEHILVCYSDGWICDQYTPFDDGVTHWMPLPEPPKGE
jgi:hypothetical protein